MASKTSPYDAHQVKELLLQALETKRGAIHIYGTAIECASNPELKREWKQYLREARKHEDVLRRVFGMLEIEPEEASVGRTVVAHIAQSLRQAMRLAQANGGPAAAELVAGECVVLAETKDHLNWALIGHVAKHGGTAPAKVLLAAFAAVENDQDHHLHHSAGWTQALWLQALGFPAVLPPPQEVKQVALVIGASPAHQGRDRML